MKQENLRTVLELMLNFHTLINQLEIRSIVFLKQLFFFFSSECTQGADLLSRKVPFLHSHCSDHSHT